MTASPDGTQKHIHSRKLNKRCLNYSLHTNWAFVRGHNKINDRAPVTKKPLYNAPIIDLFLPSFTKKVPTIDVKIHVAPIASEAKVADLMASL